jgi:hypothetical protein
MVAQRVEYLPSKHMALSSNSSTTKKKKLNKYEISFESAWLSLFFSLFKLKQVGIVCLFIHSTIFSVW